MFALGLDRIICTNDMQARLPLAFVIFHANVGQTLEMPLC